MKHTNADTKLKSNPLCYFAGTFKTHMNEAKDIGKVENTNNTNMQIAREILSCSPHPDLSLKVGCLFTVNMNCEFGHSCIIRHSHLYK